MNSNAKRLALLAMLALYAGAFLRAQDTLRLTLPEAEQTFTKKNLRLLAQGYDIDIARAQAIQAKLYNNPNLQLTGNIYNPAQKKGLDVSEHTGEYIVGIQQLVLLAGKRNKQVKLAQINTAMKEDVFFDLLRTLRYSLRNDFYQLFFLQNSINSYGTEIGYLQKLNTAYQDLLGKGMATLKDAVRIKSLLYSLESEQATLQNQVNDLNAELQLLIQNNTVYILPVVDSIPLGPVLSRYSLSSLIDSAYGNRFDLKLAENNVLYNRQNYSLQKALATPDITLGATFDKRGSFVENASFFNAAIDLPFFNRNQGNIRVAKLSTDQSRIQLQQQQSIVENDVRTAYIKALNTDKTLKSFDPDFRNQLQRLLLAITENFQKKNISLLNFTDFYESYKENVLQLNQLQSQYMQAIETLQFAIGKTIF